MTTPPTHLSGHVHGEEAVEIVARVEHEWLRDHCGQCGRPFAQTKDWATTSSGARTDLCWEPDGTCTWIFSSVTPVKLRHEAILAALATAGLLATEQEWGVRYEAEMGADLIVPGTRDESTNAAREYETATVVSRGVTAWREQA